MYLSRQLYEEALHIQFYLTLLDTYIPEEQERFAAFAAVENISSIHQKAQFFFKWIDSIHDLSEIRSRADRQSFLLNQICFAACVEGIFFFAAFAYVYFLRSKGLLNGLATGTNWVFRDESMHIGFAYEVIHTVCREEPGIFDAQMKRRVTQMINEAVVCEKSFAKDALDLGVVGLSYRDMCAYLEYIADQRLVSLGIPPQFKSKNPFSFMEMQDVQELANFFERRVTAYQMGSVSGKVALDEEF
jgi:ribonucleoside-diphosphate reductase beta chain